MCAVTEAGQRDAEQELAAMAEVLTEEPEPLTNHMHGETGVSLLAGVVSLGAACDSPMTDAENSPGRRAPGSSAKRPLVSVFPSCVSHLHLSVCCNAVMHASICVIVCQSCHVMCQNVHLWEVGPHSSSCTAAGGECRAAQGTPCTAERCISHQTHTQLIKWN